MKLHLIFNHGLATCLMLASSLPFFSVEAQSPVTHTQRLLKEDQAILEKWHKEAAASADLLNINIQTTKAEDSLPDFFGIKDPQEEEQLTAGFDIQSFGIAPTSNAIYLNYKLDKKPSKPVLYVCEIDLYGDALADLQLIYDSVTNKHSARFYGKDRQLSKRFQLLTAKATLNDELRWRIPYHELVQIAPKEWEDKIQGQKARAWMRAWSFTWDPKQGKYIDRGPAMASPRLTGRPITLAQSGDPSQYPAIYLPLTGKWYLGQGPDSPRTHRNTIAYDFWKTDHEVKSSTVIDSKENDKHYAWNQPIVLMNKGQVIRLVNGNRDIPARSVGFYPAAESNRLELLLPVQDGLTRPYMLSLLHLKKDSIQVKAKQQIDPGDELARIGNSGQSSGPHLHLSMHTWDGKKAAFKGSPVILRDVIISLNPGEASPAKWSIKLNFWIPEEGWFVESLHQPSQKDQ